MLTRSLIAAASVTALLSGTTVTASAAPAAFSDMDDFHANPAYSRFYQQKLTWEANNCPGSADPGLECARLEAPRNWHDLTKGSLTVTVSRAKGAIPAGKRLLLGVPGGPGLSGLGLALSLSKTYGLQQTHYVIGIDPRGMASSSPLTCNARIPHEFDLQDVGDDRKYTPALIQATIRNQAARIRACVTQESAQSINTEQTARDFGLLRHVLGFEKADLMGGSYGSLLGSVVARMFPNSVERVVLEANLDWFDSSYDDMTARSMQGMQAVWDRVVLPFVARHHDHYQMGRTPSEVDRTLEKIRANTTGWPGLPTDFNRHENDIRGSVDSLQNLSGKLEIFREYAADLRPEGTPGVPKDRRQAAAPSAAGEGVGITIGIETLMCGDYVGVKDAEANFSSLEGLGRALPLGLSSAILPSCPGFVPERPALTPEILHRPLRAALLTASEADAVTAYPGIRHTLGRLDRSRVRAVVIDNGFGHLRVGSVSPCALAPVTHYLTTGNLPAADVVCQAPPLALDVVDREGNVVTTVADDKVYEFGYAGSGSTLPQAMPYLVRDLSPAVPAVRQPTAAPSTAHRVVGEASWRENVARR